MSPTRGIDEVPEPFEPSVLNGKFDDLEVIELLGAGGMGVVYLARQLKLDRLVALKVIRPDVANSDEFAARFEREARALACLSHPNIVGIHDFGERDGLFYCLMEYIDGTSLAELSMAQSLTPTESLQIVSDICNAMQFAHDNGVVHRDIKPNNILVNTQGQVKIADFGLAKLNELDASVMTQLTQTRQVFGTPKYMAPEQTESAKEVDHRADIYSLGVVFYELLTGELPIGRFDLPSQRVQVDVKLDDVVLRALEKHPERRYQSARDMQTDINHYMQNPVAPPLKRAASNTAAVPVASTEGHEQGLASVVMRMFGAFLFFAACFMLTVSVSMICLPTRKSIWPAGLVLTGIVCLVVGSLLFVHGFRRRTRLPNAKPLTPPQFLFNLRGLSFMFSLLSLMAVGLPWLKMSIFNVTVYATGIETWLGLASLLVLAIGLMLLVCIDIYEAGSIRFYTVLALMSFAVMFLSYAFLGSSWGGQLISNQIGAFSGSQHTKLFAFALLVLSNFSAGIAILGMISGAISRWMKFKGS